jgi:hypothetical protein
MKDMSPELHQRIFDVFRPAISVASGAVPAQVDLDQAEKLYRECKNGPIEFEDAEHPEVRGCVALSADGQAMEMIIEPYHERPDGLTLTILVSKFAPFWNLEENSTVQ